MTVQGMHTPPELPNEHERQLTLEALGQLDTEGEERFDRVVDIAKRLFDVPIALVTLVDQDRQWFKAKRGIGIAGTDRSVSFCGHAIARDGVMVVEDALKDPRFDDNPLVIGSPFMRFYAGAPLEIAPGIRVGTLCLIDTEAREFAPSEQDLLARLAAIVRDELIRAPAQTPEDLGADDTKPTRDWIQALRAKLSGA